jgi:hypothetical protein
MTMTRIPEMRGVNSRIADLKAVTSELSLSEKRALLEELTTQVQAAALNNPQRRLAAVKVAAVAKDARTKGAFETAIKLLKRLGSDLDKVCASGDFTELNKRALELKWPPENRTQLKLVLGIIGATA